MTADAPKLMDFVLRCVDVCPAVSYVSHVSKGENISISRSRIPVVSSLMSGEELGSFLQNPAVDWGEHGDKAACRTKCLPTARETPLPPPISAGITHTHPNVLIHGAEGRSTWAKRWMLPNKFFMVFSKEMIGLGNLRRVLFWNRPVCRQTSPLVTQSLWLTQGTFSQTTKKTLKDKVHANQGKKNKYPKQHSG